MLPGSDGLISVLYDGLIYNMMIIKWIQVVERLYVILLDRMLSTKMSENFQNFVKKFPHHIKAEGN